jgi:hypothetical protein
VLPAGWHLCASSAIEAYSYDRSTGVLKIAFVKGRKAYDYPCPAGMSAAFLRAPSKGKFVESTLRPYAHRHAPVAPVPYAWPW